jgi:flagellar protein FliJ
MGSRRQRLDTLLRIRRIEEDLAKGRLATAYQAARAAQARLDEINGRYDESTASEADPAASPSGATKQSFLRRHQEVTALAQGVMIAGHRVVEAGEDVVQEREGVRTTSMRVEGLERLVDRARQAQDAETLAADQRTAEESRARPATRGHV